MPRKYSDQRPYPFKIILYDRETYEQEKRRRKAPKAGYIHQSDRWRAIRQEDAIMYFTFQILRMKRQIRRPWYCYYEVHGYGAPGVKEFLCPFTSMRASTIRKEEALKYRVQYARIISKSKEILIWLLKLPAIQYTQDLHHYLLRFIVVSPPRQTELDAYRENREQAISRALE